MLGRRRRGAEAQAAATWVVRLGRGPLSEHEQRALDRWLGENPVHRAVFDRARSAWAELGELRAAPGSLADDASLPRSSVFPAGWLGAGAMRRAAAVVALLAVGLGMATFWFGDPVLLVEADYRASPGEGRSVTLTDGSVVQLNSGSALAVRFDARERRVELLAGEAYFTVAPMRDNESRPFIVAAASGTAKALGTEFMVDRSADGADVTVTEHRVEVSVTSSTDEASSIVLSPGQAVRYDRSAGMGKPKEVNLQRATSWRRGQLVFDSARLADVVAELNRYRRGTIVIADAAMADRRVSGFFRTDDLDGALASISRELDVRTVNLPPFLTLLY